MLLRSYIAIGQAPLCGGVLISEEVMKQHKLVDSVNNSILTIFGSPSGEF